jgi:hypothetical protein
MEYPTPYIVDRPRRDAAVWWIGGLTGFSLGFALGLAVATVAQWWRAGAVRIETAPTSLTNRVVIDLTPLRKAPER